MNKAPKLLVVAAAILLLVSSLLIAVALLSPAQEVKSSPSEKVDLQQAAKARAVFEEQVAPSKQTSSTMVVPATEKWWTLVSSLAPALEISPTALPEGAKWLGFSQGQTQTKDPVEVSAFTAIYVGFDTPSQAAEYSPDCVCYKYVEGNVTTIVDTFSEFGNEAFPSYENIDPDLLKTSAGAWRINLTDWVRHTSDGTKYGTYQKLFFKTLGIDVNAPNDVIWEATSTTPEGPWTGKLENYPLDNIDVFPIGEAVNDSSIFTCDDDGLCEETDKGLFDLIQFFYLNAGEYSFGTKELADPDAPTFGTDIAQGALNPTYFEGAYMGYGYTRPSALSNVWFRLDENKELTVKFAFEE